MLLWRGFRWGASACDSLGRQAASALASRIAFAATDEWHQTFVLRGPSPVDVLIDSCGAALGLALRWGVGSRESRRLEGRSGRDGAASRISSST